MKQINIPTDKGYFMVAGVLVKYALIYVCQGVYGAIKGAFKAIDHLAARVYDKTSKAAFAGLLVFSICFGLFAAVVITMQSRAYAMTLEYENFKLKKELNRIKMYE